MNAQSGHLIVKGFVWVMSIGVVAFLLVSCISIPPTKYAGHEIATGMTKEEVKAMLGEPGHVYIPDFEALEKICPSFICHHDKTKETWDYGDFAVPDTKEILVVTFSNGKVKELYHKEWKPGDGQAVFIGGHCYGCPIPNTGYTRFGRYRYMH